MIDLTGRVAIVTGAARGIGREIALELSQYGAKVVVNYLSHVEEADEVVQLIKDMGGQSIRVQGDVTNAKDAARLIEEAQKAFGGIHILVNNAGIVHDGLIMRMSEKDWDDVINTSLRGAFLCTRSALRPMVRQHYGRIINVTSVAGIAGNVGQANYSAAKAGLIGFTKSVAKEIGSRGITVNAVAPGLVETDMTRDLPTEVWNALIGLSALGRPGTLEEIAHAVVFLASDSASYITGHVLIVDGGMGMF